MLPIQYHLPFPTCPVLTFTLYACRDSMDTKQVICRKKSNTSARAAYRANAYTAGMSDNPPAAVVLC